MFPRVGLVVGIAFAALSLAGGIAIGLEIARRRSRHLGAQGAESKQDFTAYGTARLEASRAISRAWADQIDTARTQTEEAIVSLTQRFSSIATHLDQTVSVSNAAAQSADGERGLVAIFARSELQLDSVVAALRSATETNAEMLRQILGLRDFIEELQHMANDVARIAAETRLLSLNSTIEAARIGEAGRGFAVVADEIRKLSSLSAATGERIAEKVARINAAIGSSCAAAEASAQHGGTITSQAGETIHSVLAELRQATDNLASTARTLREDGIAIKGEVSEALVQLQFQDRTSQILAHAQSSIQRLPAFEEEQRQRLEKEGRLVLPDPAAILDQLEHSYSTDEERLQHRARAAEVRAEPEITFF